MKHSIEHPQGFTLIELLIALSIFVLLSIMSYSALNSVTMQREVVEQQADELKYLQMALLLFERDLQQVVDRDSYIGDQQQRVPAMTFSTVGEYQLTFTRTGWSNPLHSARSHLQKIRYRYEDKRLYREHWIHIDQLIDQIPQKSMLLENVTHFSLRFFDHDQRWQESWPQRDAENKIVQSLPQAIEIKLNIDGWGEISRLIKII